MTDEDKLKGPWTDWVSFQNKMFEQWMNVFKTGLKGTTPGPEAAVTSPFDFYQAWRDTWGKTWGWGLEAAAAEGLGAGVYDKMLGASKVYSQVLSFWSQAMTRLAKLPADQTLDLDALKALQDDLRTDYQQVMTALWGTIPSPVPQESLKAFLESGGTAWDVLWRFLEPSFKHLSQVPATAQKYFAGDTGAAAELAGLFRKTYHDTIGRSLRAPSLGFFREAVVKFQRTVDAYIEYQAAAQEFNSLFQATSQKAMEKVLGRLTEFAGRQPSPQISKEFYRLWLTINEETYHDLFLSKEFTRILREVLTRGLQFRKWWDDLSDDLLELTNLPGKKDMDEVYRAIYELKKEVRWQRRRIKELERCLGPAAVAQT
ncbi:MAG: poly(R)-hydroxyalkanoic acid synthase subunit PhaE [Thermodesulfobacteriota bacterium]